MPRDRTGSLMKGTLSQPFASLNNELKDVFKPLTTRESESPETVETERKNSLVTYEEKRQKNYEVCLSFWEILCFNLI